MSQEINAETETVVLDDVKKKQSLKKKKKHKELKSFIIQICVIGVLVAITLIFFLNIKIVHENNMYPSIRDGELIVVSKLSQPLNESIVLYKTEDGIEHLGRIMAFGGNEVIVSEDGGVSVDGNITYQTVPYITSLGSIDYPYHVPENSFFVLNDFREEESDSRTYGAISKSQIIGVVIFAMQYRGF